MELNFSENLSLMESSQILCISEERKGALVSIIETAIKQVASNDNLLFAHGLKMITDKCLTTEECIFSTIAFAKAYDALYLSWNGFLQRANEARHLFL